MLPNNIKKNIITALICAGLFTACATPEKFAEKMYAAKGRNIEDVKKEFGKPTVEGFIAGGNYILDYTQLGVIHGIYYDCHFWFYADPRTNMVKDVNWVGSRCKSN